MSKGRYILNALVYVWTGFILGMGIIDNDPVIKILCVVGLMMTTMLFVYNTWIYLFRKEIKT